MKFKYIKTGVKGLVVSILTSLIMLIPIWIVRWLVTIKSMLVLGVVFGVILFFAYLITWGWIANKLWRWNGRK